MDDDCSHESDETEEKREENEINHDEGEKKNIFARKKIVEWLEKYKKRISREERKDGDRIRKTMKTFEKTRLEGKERERPGYEKEFKHFSSSIWNSKEELFFFIVLYPEREVFFFPFFSPLHLSYSIFFRTHEGKYETRDHYLAADATNLTQYISLYF